MKYLTHIIFILLFIFISACGSSEKKHNSSAKQKLKPINVRSFANKTVATIGDIIKYSVTINHNPEIELKTDDLVKIITGISKIKGLPLIKTDIKDPDNIENRVNIEHIYTFRAEEIGSYILPSVIVKYKTKGSDTYRDFRTSRIFIEVKSILKEGETASDIRDIKSLMEIERDLKQIIIISLICIALLIGVFLLFKKFRKKSISGEVVTKPPIPPHILALQELADLKDKDLINKGEIKLFYFELSEIFRRYLEGRYNFPAIDWTTEEIAPYLKTVPELTIQGEITIENALTFLRNTDRVKFAKHTPQSDEPDLEFNKAKLFVETTKPVEVQE